MCLYEPRIYTYTTIVDKGIAWNSDPNHSDRRKKIGEVAK